MTSASRIRFPAAAILIVALFTMCASGFEVSSVITEPRGEQPDGTPVTVTADIDFATTSNLSFPADSELHLATDLYTAQWEPVLFLDGVQTKLIPETGNSMILRGWELSFPRTQHLRLRLTLTGTLPANRGGDLIRVQEIDAAREVQSTSRVELPAVPVTPLPVVTPKPTTRRTFT